jgi:uncharacterized protein (DUF169 family)
VNNVSQLLDLSRPPIAIAFLSEAPEGVAAWDGGAVPAGCVFWDKAMNGEVFVTVPSDHHNCAVGSYVHNIALPEDRAHELGETLEFMDKNGYVAMSEVPGIPALAESPSFVAYGPVDRVSFTPDVVVLSAKPSQAMLIYEAAIKAGASTGLTNALGRPACAVLPLTIATGQASLSLGCRGNRTFTGIGNDEMYVAIPGNKWAEVVSSVADTCTADATMTAHYSAHKAAFA